MEAGKDVGAVIQAVAILRVLSDARVAVGVTAIARSANLNPSTTLNILRTLVKEGLVAFEPSTKTYQLDIGLLELGRAMLRKTKVELLRPKLQQIANRYEATTTVWLVAGDEQILLASRIIPEVGVHIEFRLAARFPAYAGAVGRMIAAARGTPREKLEASFAQIRWAAPLRFASYWKGVREAKENGYAVDSATLLRSVVSIASVILDEDGVPAIAIAAHTFLGQLPDTSVTALGAELRQLCSNFRPALFG